MRIETSAQSLLSNAVGQSALSKLVSLQRLSLNDVKETSTDANGTWRDCEATAILNTGFQSIEYKLWISDDKQFLQIVSSQQVSGTKGQLQAASKRRSDIENQFMRKLRRVGSHLLEPTDRRQMTRSSWSSISIETGRCWGIHLFTRSRVPILA